MRPGKNLVSAILSIVLVVGLFPATALASDDAIALRSGSLLAGQAVGSYGVDLASEGYQTAINPYYAYRGSATDGSGGECTWYAWGRAHEKLGVGLPGPGDGKAWHAKYWTSNCASYGYPTGVEALANSIMVEDDGSEYGHVYFVERVDNGYAYVSEGNYLGKYNEDAINLTTKVRDSWPGHTLGTLSYIYLIQENPMTAAASDKSVETGSVKGAAKKLSPFSVAGAVGAVTFSDAGSSKRLSVSSNGKVTVKKGTPAGTYTAKANVRAAGDSRYKEKTVAVEARIQVVSPPSAPAALTFKTSPLIAGFKASWSKAKGADGYEVAYMSAKDKTKGWQTSTVGNASSTKITGLKQSALYTVKIRSFAKAIDGKRYYSGWGAVSNVKTKASTYKIAFKANGGKGLMKAQAIQIGKSTALNANKFTRSGYRFAGWNTKANGKGKTYASKAKVKNLAKAGKTAILYAQWKRISPGTAYVKVDSASFGSNTVAGARFQVLSYAAYDGSSKYKITMSKSGYTRTLVSDSGDRCVTNGRYLFYSKPSGSRQYVKELGYAIEKTTLYRLDIKTGGLKTLSSGLYQRPYGCDGNHLFYSTDRGLYGNDLYTLDLRSSKKRLMGRGVSDATYSNGYVITTPHHNVGINLPVYSFKPDGTGKKAIAKALMVRVLKNRVYYIVINDKNPSLYRKYSCSLRGGNKKAITGWDDFHNVEFSHDLTKP